MSCERHERLSEIFAEAIERPPHERERFLDACCGNDVELRREVERLLSSDVAANALDQPLTTERVRAAIAESLPAYEPLQPQRIGEYEILGVLGRGGMGTVYRARQSNPPRPVALKVMSAGLATTEATRRFEFEAAVLARLTHPGVARIYEAGLHRLGSGLPVRFFAMELVEGVPITEYAELHRLDVRQRLRLFVAVCEAVQHAHQNGVIHRDLKPANILVDAAGRPRVLDFGVARSLEADAALSSMHTIAGQLVGTLPYMSPEQVTGDPNQIDTRSDIYALGVIAYELLTGQLPYDVHNRALPDAARIIQDAAPARLSSIDRRFRGDLETILSKALEKEKQRRYASLSDFIADIERYLADQPIAARPPSVLYQFRKFAQRNRLFVGGVAASLLFLVLAVIGTGYGLVEARRGRELAEKRLQRAEAAEVAARREQAHRDAVARFLLRVITTPRPGEKGRSVTVVEALEVARDEVDREFADQPETRGAVHLELGAAYYELGQPDIARTHLRKGYELLRRTLGEDHPDVAKAANDLGVALTRKDSPADLEEAFALLAGALEQTRARHGPESLEVVAALNNLANVHWCREEYEVAEALTREALRICQAKSAAEHPLALQAQTNLAFLRGRQGDLQGKAALLGDLVQRMDRVRGAEHHDTLQTAQKLADALVEIGRPAEAEPIHRRTIDALGRVLGENHPSTLMAAHQFALCLFRLGKTDECERLLRKTLAQEREALGSAAFLTTATLSVLTDVLLRDGRFADAEECLRELRMTAEKLAGPDSPQVLARQVWLAVCIAEQGRLDEARLLLDEAERRIKPDKPDKEKLGPLLQVARAKLLWTNGKFDAAESSLLRAEQELSADGPDDNETRLARMYLIQLYNAWNKTDLALDWKAKLASQSPR